MAVEKVRALTIETGDSVKSINQLKEQIADLKKQLDDKNLSQEEAIRLSKQLSDSENELASSLKSADETSKQLEQTYSALAAKLKELETELSTTTDNIKRANLSSEIDNIRSSMSGIESATGQLRGTFDGFGNVISQIGSKGCSTLISGLTNLNYSLDQVSASTNKINQETSKNSNIISAASQEVNLLAQSEEQLSKSAANANSSVGDVVPAINAIAGAGNAVTSSIQGVNSAMKALESDPFIAMIAVASGVLIKISQSIKKNEVAMTAFKTALAPLSGLLTFMKEQFTQILLKVAELVGWITNKLTSAMTKLGEKMAGWAEKLGWDGLAGRIRGAVAAMKEAREISKLQADLDKRQLEIKRSNAEIQKEIAELEKEQAKYSRDSVEYLTLQSQIEDKKAQIAKNNLEIAEQEYELQKRKNATHTATKTELEKENELYVKMLQAQKEMVNADTSRLKQAQEQVNALEGSYNALAKQLSVLREQWQATNDEAERQSIAKHIKVLDREMSKMERSLGSAMDRLGDLRYGLDGIGAKGASKAVGGINMVSKALKGLASNPVFLVLGGIALVITAIVKAIQKNERAVRQLQQALSPLQGIMNALSNLMDKITDKIAGGLTKAIDAITEKIKSAAEWLADVAGKLGLEKLQNQLNSIVKSMNDNAEYTSELLKMDKERRDIAEENAELEVKLAELKRDFALAEGDLNKQRKISAEIGRLDNQIKQNSYNLAKKEYELIVKRNSLTQSTQADLDEESQARIRMLQAQKDLFNLEKEEKRVIRSTNKELTEAQKRREKLIENLRTWRKNQLEDLGMSESELYKQYLEDLDTLGKEPQKLAKESQNKYEERLKDYLELRKTLEDKYNSDLKARRQKYYNNEVKELQNFENRQRSVIESGLIDLQKVAEESYKKTGNLAQYQLEQTDIMLKKIDLDLEVARDTEAELSDIYEKMVDMDLDTTEVENNLAAARIKLAQLELEQTIAIREKEQEERDKMFEGLDEALGILNDYASAITSIGQGVSSEWAGVFSVMQQGLANVKRELDQGGKSWKVYGHIAVTALNAAAQTMLALADEQDESSKKGFEAQKNFQIAAIIMNGAAGILDSWVSAMSPNNAWMTLPGQIAMGTVMSSLMATLMGVQLAQVQKTQFEGNSGTSSTSLNPGITASLVAPVQYTSQVRGAYTEDTQDDSRIYVSVTEINEVGKRVSVAENESRY